MLSKVKFFIHNLCYCEVGGLSQFRYFFLTECTNQMKIAAFC